MDIMEHLVFLSLGSNVGDRAAMLAKAIEAIAAIPGISLGMPQDVASLYETAPVGGPGGQPRFLNTAARLRTSRTPHDLLRLLLETEATLGRTPGERWGPRAVDIDLLLFDDSVIESQDLTVPHPRMHERRFVLEPLAEIAPEVVHPRLGLTTRQLAQRARVEQEADQVLRIAGPSWVAASESLALR